MVSIALYCLRDFAIVLRQVAQLPCLALSGYLYRAEVHCINTGPAYRIHSAGGRLAPKGVLGCYPPLPYCFCVLASFSV